MNPITARPLNLRTRYIAEYSNVSSLSALIRIIKFAGFFLKLDSTKFNRPIQTVRLPSIRSIWSCSDSCRKFMSALTRAV